MKSNDPIISVAICAYKRPDTIEDVILSFQLQTVKRSELVIIDDCVSDTSVQKVVEKYQKRDKRIRFIKNKKNLGYSKNYLKALLTAKGKYIVTLGDDDIFLNTKTLQTYIDTFEKYPKVGFIYANILQFNQSYQLDYVIDYFKKNTIYKTIPDALQHIWLSSCFIAGIGLRNTGDFDKLYPKDDLLFPQVEFIGKFLGEWQAYGLSPFLIGARAHQGQLGFAAIKGQKIKKNEKHSVIELDIIYDTVLAYYQKKLKININLSHDFIHNFFEKTHATILPTEKINTGNKIMLQTVIQAYKNNPMVVINPRFMFYFIISFILPRSVLFQLKEWRKHQLINTHHQKEKTYFNAFIQKMHKEVASV